MSEVHFKGLSAEQRENAHAALLGAFGRAPIDAVTPIAGGASTASTFRVDCCGRRYLLRVEGEPSPLRNPHQYVSMRIAADAGIAPKIRYVDEAARVAVIDFIAQQPLQTYYAGSTQRFSEAGRSVLRRLSASPMVEYARLIRGERGSRGHPSLPPR
jgi:hypothetical protein